MSDFIKENRVNKYHISIPNFHTGNELNLKVDFWFVLKTLYKIFTNFPRKSWRWGVSWCKKGPFFQLGKIRSLSRNLDRFIEEFCLEFMSAKVYSKFGEILPWQPEASKRVNLSQG